MRQTFLLHNPAYPANVAQDRQQNKKYCYGVAEAQSLGRLVIAANHGGARETVVDGETGWLTPPGDAKALASILNRVLVQTAEERQVFSEQAIQHIRNKYSKSNMCNKTLEVYNALLGSKFSKLSSPS